jgi:hypothetical protein
MEVKTLLAAAAFAGAGVVPSFSTSAPAFWAASGSRQLSAAIVQVLA